MKELLFSITKKDFSIDYYSGTGAGGQHRNKHQNCVRLKHLDSGVVATGQSSRSRQQNLREALHSLIANVTFKLWHTRKVNECLTGKTVADAVDEMMCDENIKIETVNDDGKWV
jgi:protein subunit release factor A